MPGRESSSRMDSIAWYRSARPYETSSEVAQQIDQAREQAASVAHFIDATPSSQTVRVVMEDAIRFADFGPRHATDVWFRMYVMRKYQEQRELQAGKLFKFLVHGNEHVRPSSIFGSARNATPEQIEVHVVNSAYVYAALDADIIRMLLDMFAEEPENFDYAVSAVIPELLAVARERFPAQGF